MPFPTSRILVLVKLGFALALACGIKAAPRPPERVAIPPPTTETTPPQDGARGPLEASPPDAGTAAP